MSLRASCIDGGLYIRSGVVLVPPPQRDPGLCAVGRLELRHGNSWTERGTVAYANRSNIVLHGASLYGSEIDGYLAIVVSKAGSVVWVGRPQDVIEVRHPEFQGRSTADILKYVLGEVMNYQTQPAPRAPRAPRVPTGPNTYGEACTSPAPVEDQIKAAELKVEALRQRQAEEQAAAAAKAIADARTAELDHARKLVELRAVLCDEVRSIENGRTAIAYMNLAEYRKELAEYADSLGYKFVTVGLGGAVCLCKRGAK